ncbi:MAG: 2-oxoacid:acceptor oxidoreductase family protein [Candidatus Bathyarchaeia archaeon]|nr:MAG: 2-oxoglutarate ferredoxin oxidoreductase subunit gamma [Candidatus Bathyarchaeota archaeon]
MTKTEIRICGLGGQGVILAGQILGKAAIYDGKNAVQTQGYGAEARGSAAKSEVIMSEDKIGFPFVRKCDVLIIMNQEAVEKNTVDLKQNGVLLVDSSTVKEIPKIKAKVIKVPATENAEKLFGAKIYANMIMLGALIEATCMVSEKAVEKAIEDSVGKENAKINKQAYKKGKELLKCSFTNQE